MTALQPLWNFPDRTPSPSSKALGGGGAFRRAAHRAPPPPPPADQVLFRDAAPESAIDAADTVDLLPLLNAHFDGAAYDLDGLERAVAARFLGDRPLLRDPVLMEYADDVRDFGELRDRFAAEFGATRRQQRMPRDLQEALLSEGRMGVLEPALEVWGPAGRGAGSPSASFSDWSQFRNFLPFPHFLGFFFANSRNFLQFFFCNFPPFFRHCLLHVPLPCVFVPCVSPVQKCWCPLRVREVW